MSGGQGRGEGGGGEEVVRIGSRVVPLKLILDVDASTGRVVFVDPVSRRLVWCKLGVEERC